MDGICGCFKDCIRSANTHEVNSKDVIRYGTNVGRMGCAAGLNISGCVQNKIFEQMNVTTIEEYKGKVATGRLPTKNEACEEGMEACCCDLPAYLVMDCFSFMFHLGQCGSQLLDRSSSGLRKRTICYFGSAMCGDLLGMPLSFVHLAVRISCLACHPSSHECIDNIIFWNNISTWVKGDAESKRSSLQSLTSKEDNLIDYQPSSEEQFWKQFHEALGQPSKVFDTSALSKISTPTPTPAGETVNPIHIVEPKKKVDPLREKWTKEYVNALYQKYLEQGKDYDAAWKSIQSEWETDFFSEVRWKLGKELAKSEQLPYTTPDPSCLATPIGWGDGGRSPRPSPLTPGELAEQIKPNDIVVEVVETCV